MGALCYTLLEKEEDLADFDCGNPSVNALVSGVYYPNILKQAKVFKISVQNTRVGFCAVSVTHISVDNADAPIAEYYSNAPSYGALKIDFIAVDKRVHRKGIGTTALAFFVSEARRFYEIVPIRVLVIDALREKMDWYTARGFDLLNSKERSDISPTVKMYIDLISAEDKDKLEEYVANNV